MSSTIPSARKWIANPLLAAARALVSEACFVRCGMTGTTGAVACTSPTSLLESMSLWFHKI